MDRCGAVRRGETVFVREAADVADIAEQACGSERSDADEACEAAAALRDERLDPLLEFADLAVESMEAVKALAGEFGLDAAEDAKRARRCLEVARRDEVRAAALVAWDDARATPPPRRTKTNPAPTTPRSATSLSQPPFSHP